MKRLTLAFAAILALAPVHARAQVQPDEGQPAGQMDGDDAKKDDKTPKVDCVPIMKKADAAFAGLKSLTYNARCYATGGVAMRSPDVAAVVRMLRIGQEPEPESKDAAHQRRRRGEKPAFEWTFDIRGTARAPGQAQ